MPAENNKKSSSVGTVVFMVGAVLFAGVGGVLLSQLLSQKYPQEPVVAIVTAARHIPAGGRLEKSSLRKVAWPRSSVPEGAQYSIKKLLARKGVPLVSIAKGSPVLSSQLSAPRSGWGVAAKLEPGERAMAIRTDDSITLAQLIYPGAKVDVVSTMRRAGSYSSGEVVTRILLQNVTVLAVGPRIDAASAAHSKKKEKSRDRAAKRVVTLALTPEQAERMVLARREGKIDLVLRSPQDDETVTTKGISPEDIVGRAAAEPGKKAAPPPPLAQEPPKPRRSVRHRRARRPARTPRPAAVRPPAAPPKSKGPRVTRGY